mmetsp:Transcript_35733/g.41407  ORF Transcript_35733/g.41407 Transcript_35733/m.41407 type:complete len:87 (-) Transcript_35733:90-350(-)|eukprot:CAMPEP_0194359540 /NCGR_PEP_ID=MMETSP0174-20130528/6788_1 /TAXON_ID=216777 /ORGANISM="Proboscia alata, Strain PI-D3" /LENGTH=86 /DNA_ID=CAMNT_0039130485 /DNA_START=1212 /DNA_END=1472 /DNA_ORIENTATION=+
MDTKDDMETEEEQVPLNNDMSERGPNGDDRGNDYSNDVIRKDKHGNDTDKFRHYKEDWDVTKINDLVHRLIQAICVDSMLDDIKHQ